MAGKKNAKEEYELQKKRHRECRDKIYENYPQVKKFEASKKRWINFLLLYGLLLTLAKLLTTLYMVNGISEISIFLFLGFVTSFAPALIFLLCALGQWKSALPLYLLSMLYLVQWVYPFSNGTISSLSQFVQASMDGFVEYPIQTSLDFFSLAYGILILVTAIRLTLSRENRELSAQSTVLLLKVKEAMSAGIKRDGQ